MLRSTLSGWIIIRFFPKVHDAVKHETAHGNRKTKKDHIRRGQFGDQCPQNEITGDGAAYRQKMSHLFPPDLGYSNPRPPEGGGFIME
jgi:hypothetical protein